MSFIWTVKEFIHSIQISLYSSFNYEHCLKAAKQKYKKFRTKSTQFKILILNDP